MNSRLSFFVIGCAVLGTLFFLLVKNPEEKTFASEDGRLIIEVNTGEAAWIDIFASGDEYLLSSRTSITQPATLKFLSEEEAVQLGFFDSTIGMWRLTETQINKTTGELVTQTTEFNTRWRVFAPTTVAEPNFDAELAALISASPEGAVGYDATVGFSQGNQEPVAFVGGTYSGGCAGKFVYTGDTTMTSQEIRFSDALSYTLVVLWQLGEGCRGYEVIE